MFRFSIREMMLVTLVVALMLGWWLHYRRVDANRQAVIEHAERLKNVLAAAEREVELLKDEYESIRIFAEESSKPNGKPVGYYHDSRHCNVDWAVLNKPIPTGEW